MSANAIRRVGRVGLLRLALAVAFACGAIFHLASLAKPEIGSSSPPLRHLTFVAINLFFAGAMLRPPRWLVVPAAIFVVQQGYGHGRDLGVALGEGHMDFQSLVALLVLPFVGYVAVRAVRDPDRDRDRDHSGSFVTKI